MAQIIQTEDLQPSALVEPFRNWIYCGLDSGATREIFDEIFPQLDEYSSRIYAWSRTQQAPAFAMMRRGILIDKNAITDVNTDWPSRTTMCGV